MLSTEINFLHLDDKEGYENRKEPGGGTFSFSWKNGLWRRVLIGKQVNTLWGAERFMGGSISHYHVGLGSLQCAGPLCTISLSTLMVSQ